ncbi:MAG: MarR family transcriptional regulator [Actinobacteria bacterium]|nr:MarR family transcriptional regulator [Actinomycetota bacterium]
MTPMSDDDYANLLEFRSALRRFLHWSEEQARGEGLAPSQHQLLLAVKGHRGPDGPTVGEVAGYLAVRHHSVVGLIDRAEKSGLVRRVQDSDDHRVIRLQLTATGDELIKRLSQVHLEELRRFRAFPLPTS